MNIFGHEIDGSHVDTKIILPQICFWVSYLFIKESYSVLYLVCVCWSGTLLGSGWIGWLRIVRRSIGLRLIVLFVGFEDSRVCPVSMG